MKTSLSLRLAIYGLSALITVQPVSAQIVIDSNANQQTQIEQGAQGAPVININTPSAAGVSHNQFQEYNVGENHLILNNSQQGAETVINGSISANPNLTNGSATIIVNEVTGTNPSQLNGFTEVGGDSAEVVIANPNGITCDGCGFINTPKATLSTGQVNINNGQLMSLTVNQGTIRIEGDGVNVGNVDQFELSTRNLVIDAPVLAKELKVVTGTNTIEYATGEVTEITSQGQAPEYAIDSSQLGGMYANTIHLIATENGIGVRTQGEMATNIGDIVLQADGQLQVSRAISAGDLTMSSTQTVTIEDTAYGTNTSINANTLNNQGLLASERQLSVNTQTLNNTGTVVAGLNRDNSLNAEGQANIIVTDELLNEGDLIASGDTTIQAQSINNSGQVQANNVRINAQDLKQNGNIIATDTIELSLPNYTATENHGLSAGNELIINTDRFSNDTTFAHDSALRINASNRVTNQGLISSQGLSVNTQTLTNQSDATITSGADLLVEAKTLENHGIITASGDMTIDAEQVINRDVLGAGGDLTINASTIDNTSQVAHEGIGADASLLFSVGDMSLYSDSLRNRFGDIYTLGDLTIARDASLQANDWVLNESGLIEAAGSGIIATQLLSNIRFLPERVNRDDLCANYPDEWSYGCSGSVVGGSAFGVPDGFSPIQAWLFSEAFELINTPYDQQYEAGLAHLEILGLAVAKPTLIHMGNNLQINAGGLINYGGDITAVNNLSINANELDNSTIVALSPHYSEFYSGPDLAMSRVLQSYNPGALIPVGVGLEDYEPGAYLEQGGGWRLGDERGDPLPEDLAEREREINALFTQGEYAIGGGNFLNPQPYHYVFLPSRIQAGGELTIVATNTINNGLAQEVPPAATEPLTTLVVPTVSAPVISGNTVNTQFTFPTVNFEALANAIPPASDFVQVDVIPTDTIDVGNGGLFEEQVGGDVLIATNAAVAGLVNARGSDYLLQQLNYAPEQDVKRLGDGLYESRLIRQAIFAQTGQRYIHQSLHSDQAQYEYLMANAINAYQALGLTVGIGLNPEQVAGLTHDIVWLEQRTINGQQVLVPTLYLAQVRADDLFNPNGLLTAGIGGGNINIKALGNFTNTSQLLANANLSVSSQQNIVNRAGTIKAGGDVALSAANNVELTPVSHTTREGLVERDTLTLGSVTAGGNLDISAGNDIKVTSTALEADQTINLNAGNNVDINAQSNVTREREYIYTETTITRPRVTPEIPGRGTKDDQAQTERARTVEVVDTVTEDAQYSTLTAQQVNIQAGANTQIQDTQIDAQALDIGATNDISLSHSLLNVGDKAVINAGNDLSLSNTALNVEGNLSLQAGNRISSASDDRPFALINPLVVGNRINVGSTDEPWQAQSGNLLLVAGDIRLDNASQWLANNIVLSAETDLTLEGTALNAQRNLTLLAGNDLTVGTQVQENSSTQHHSKGYSTERTVTHQGSQLTAGGDMTLAAGNDLRVTGSELTADQNISLNAENDITIEASQELQETYSYTRKKKDFGRSKETTVYTLDVTHQGSNISAGGSLTINSEQDEEGQITRFESGQVTVVGSQLQAQEDLIVFGDEGVDILEQQDLHEYNRTTKKTGFLGLSRSQEDITSQQRVVQSSSLTTNDDDLSLLSGEDININGSQVVAGDSTYLAAEGEVNITAAEQHQQSSYDYKKRTVGVFGSGGLGLTVGEQSLRMGNRQESTEQISSTVGALAGDVTIEAGEDLSITASEVLAIEGDVNLQGDNVVINSANNTSSQSQYQRASQAGISVSISNGALQTMQQVYNDVEAAGDTDNETLQALYGWRAGRVLYQESEQLQEAITNPGGQTFGLNISAGASSSRSQSSSSNEQVVGSQITAGGDVAITAHQDATLEAANVQANTIDLTVGRDLILESAESSSTTNSTNSSRGASIGFTIGSNGNGISVSANQGRGHLNESDDQYLETQLNAREQVSLTVGNDATLEGAQVSGERITANIGGDLTIISQQDHYDLDQEQSQQGLSVSTSSVSVNVSDLDAQSTSTSVQEQSGFFAGEGGFDIEVAGHTDLQAGAIASEADPEQNRLSTNTLSTSNLENQASFEVDSSSIGFQAQLAEQPLGSEQTNGLAGGYAGDSGSANGTTAAVISEGDIDVRSQTEAQTQQQLANIERELANDVVDRLFDSSDVQEFQDNSRITEIFAQEAFRVVGDIYQNLDNAEANLRAAQEQGWPEEAIAELQARVDAERAQVGLPKELAHALAGGLTALAGGGSFIDGAMAAGVSEAVAHQLNEQRVTNPLLRNLISTMIGGALSGEQGALLTATADRFNRQLHIEELRFIYNNDRIERFIEYYESNTGRSLSRNEALRLLGQTAVGMVDGAWSQQIEELEDRIDDGDQWHNGIFTNGDVWRRGMSYAQYFLIKETEGLSFNDSPDTTRAYFYATPAEYNDGDIFLETFDNARVREVYEDHIAPDEEWHDYLAGGVVGNTSGFVVGVVTGGLQGAVMDSIEGVREAVDPETYTAAASAIDRATELYFNDREEFDRLMDQLPDEMADAIIGEFNNYRNRVFLYEVQGRDYASWEESASGAAHQGINFVNPLAKIAMFAKLARLLNRFDSDRVGDQVDFDLPDRNDLPEGYRDLSNTSVGANLTADDLPEGYRRVADPDGNIVVIDADNNVVDIDDLPDVRGISAHTSDNWISEFNLSNVWQQFDADVRVSGNRTDFFVNMIETTGDASRSDFMSIINGMKNRARQNGSTVLRIEGVPATESVERFFSRGTPVLDRPGVYRIEIPLD